MYEYVVCIGVGSVILGCATCCYKIYDTLTSTYIRWTLITNLYMMMQLSANINVIAAKAKLRIDFLFCYAPINTHN